MSDKHFFRLEILDRDGLWTIHVNDFETFEEAEQEAIPSVTIYSGDSRGYRITEHKEQLCKLMRW